MKLCDTCIYRNNVEQLKPCIIYRDDCEYYEREEDMTVDREDAVVRLNAIKQFMGYDKNSELVKVTQKSLDMAIVALEHSYIMCTECKNFEKSDNYCRMLQINFLPDEFGCNKGERK